MGWHIHATRPDAPLADRVMVEIAMDWVDVLRQGGYAIYRTDQRGDVAVVERPGGELAVMTSR